MKHFFEHLFTGNRTHEAGALAAQQEIEPTPDVEHEESETAESQEHDPALQVEAEQDNISESSRRERAMEIPESFDPEELLQDARIKVGPSERQQLLGLLTNYGASTARAEGKAVFDATDLGVAENGKPRGEHETLGALKEKRGERPYYGSIRPALFLVSEYLAGRDGSPMKFDGTRNVMFSIRNDVIFSFKAEKDWDEPHNRAKTNIIIDVWGAGHGPLMFDDKARFIAAKE